jgi:hypothetical protein
MTALFPDRPDHQRIPNAASEVVEEIIEGVAPVALLVVGSLGPLCPVHDHQPEPTHREIVLFDGPVRTATEALPPTEGPPFVPRHDVNADVIRRHWNAQQHSAVSVVREYSGGPPCNEPHALLISDADGPAFGGLGDGPKSYDRLSTSPNPLFSEGPRAPADSGKWIAACATSRATASSNVFALPVALKPRD